VENLNATTAGAAIDVATNVSTHPFDTSTTPTGNPMVDQDGNPTQLQIDAWMQAHGKVKYFKVDGLKIYFKQPTRLLVKAANSALAKSRDVDAYQETILKNTQLNFIHETAADVELYFALANRVDEIITSKVADLGN